MPSTPTHRSHPTPGSADERSRGRQEVGSSYQEPLSYVSDPPEPEQALARRRRVDTIPRGVEQLTGEDILSSPSWVEPREPVLTVTFTRTEYARFIELMNEQYSAAQRLGHDQASAQFMNVISQMMSAMATIFQEGQLWHDEAHRQHEETVRLHQLVQAFQQREEQWRREAATAVTQASAQVEFEIKSQAEQGFQAKVKATNAELLQAKQWLDEGQRKWKEQEAELQRARARRDEYAQKISELEGTLLSYKTRCEVLERKLMTAEQILGPSEQDWDQRQARQRQEIEREKVLASTAVSNAETYRADLMAERDYADRLDKELQNVRLELEHLRGESTSYPAALATNPTEEESLRMSIAISSRWKARYHSVRRGPTKIRT